MLDRIVTAQAASEFIRDGDTVIVGGSGGMGIANAVLVELEKRFLETESPRCADRHSYDRYWCIYE